MCRSEDVTLLMPRTTTQVGPAVGINGADDLVMSRFLLQRVAEDLQVVVSLDPKVKLCLRGTADVESCLDEVLPA